MAACALHSAYRPDLRPARRDAGDQGTFDGLKAFIDPIGTIGREMNDKVEQALLMAAGMAWQAGWTLVLGFTISALLQAVVSTEEMKRAFGRDGLREIARASAAGAASSSCSYASAAIMRTLFKKGASLVTSLAFLFASTNLVLELCVILNLLMGWQFMAGERIGGIVLILVMSFLVKLTYPERLAETARRYKEAAGGHNHMTSTVKGATLGKKLLNLNVLQRRSGLPIARTRGGAAPCAKAGFYSNVMADSRTNQGGGAHGDCAPKCHAHCWPQDRRAAQSCADHPQRRQTDERSH